MSNIIKKLHKPFQSNPLQRDPADLVAPHVSQFVITNSGKFVVTDSGLYVVTG